MPGKVRVNPHRTPPNLGGDQDIFLKTKGRQTIGVFYVAKTKAQTKAKTIKDKTQQSALSTLAWGEHRLSRPFKRKTKKADDIRDLRISEFNAEKSNNINNTCLRISRNFSAPKQRIRMDKHLGLSENVGLIFPMIAIFHRDNDQQNHWVQWGTQHFQTHPHENQWMIQCCGSIGTPTLEP